MGEYAENERGEEIKIGTLEEMYYLRWDQRHKVKALPGNVDPVKQVAEIRFRFPWPDEDTTEPGDFHKHGFERAVAVHGFTPPSDKFGHYSVQFHAPAGYLLSLPCPEAGTLPSGLIVHRNGFAGAVQLVQQRYRPGIGLVPVLRCGGCGAKYRLEERAEIEALAVACRTEGDEADRRERQSREFHDRKDGPHNWAPMPGVWWHTVADRILAGLECATTP